MKPSEIKELRLSIDLLQKEFGQRLGVSATSINSWEMGRSKPSIRHKRALKQLRLEVEAELARERGKRRRLLGRANENGLHST